MSFIRTVKTASGATAVQIAFKKYGRIQKIIHIGSAHSREELQVLFSLAKVRMRGAQRSLFDEPEAEIGVGLKQSFSGLLLEVLLDQFNRLEFNVLHDLDFAYLCIARIIEPMSKLESTKVLTDLGVEGISKDRIYRCLNRVIKNDYRSQISNLCFKRADWSGFSLVLFDVTALYFESQEGENFRKSGISKERRLEPKIVVGLLADQSGFPLAITRFEGNNTILPVITALKREHQLTDITIVSDAALLSSENLHTLSQAGYRYIVSSKMHKIPYGITEYQENDHTLSDNQIITVPGDEYRIIYQYRTKRAALDIRNIEKQIAKAMKIINKQAPAGSAKFLTVTAKEKKLNQALIDTAYTLAGIKGYITNLTHPDDKIIAYYHQLLQVEASFRVAKSDLKARPIFHYRHEAIEAYITIVLTTLAIGRTIEKLSGIRLGQFIKNLRPIRNGVVSINGKEYPAKAIIPPSIISLLKKIKSGH